MDPITASIAVTAVTTAAMSAIQGVQGSQAANAQAQSADYNATVLRQQGVADTATAASNEAMSLRKSAGELGEQGAALGQNNIGTGGSAGAVEKQSARDTRMDALNIWYGGQLQKYQADNAATAEDYQARVDRSNAKSSLLMGSIGAGTALLKGGAQAYGAANGIMPNLGSGGI